MDEKDTEIARLQGRVEGLEAAKRGFNPVHFLAWLVIAGLAVLVALFLFGALVPEETSDQRGARIAASINAECDLKWTKTEAAAGECRRQAFDRHAADGFR